MAKRKTGHGIEWLNQPGYKGESWNPMTGCTPVSPGCQNCWAADLHTKRRNATWTKGPRPKQYDEPFSKIQLFPERLAEPLSWKKPRSVAVCLMGDLFHDDVPDEFIAKVFCVMIMSPLHRFHILTKRAERMRDFLHTKPWVGQEFRAGRGEQVLAEATITRSVAPNVRLGVSVENQQTADERIPHLLKCPARVHFVSFEPALDWIDLTPWLCDNCEGNHDPGVDACSICEGESIGWTIVGHESGKGARVGNIGDVDLVVHQCRHAGTPVYVKQINIGGKLLKVPHGEPYPDAWPTKLRVREFPRGEA
ncbi:hypothetical protein LCGC14_1149480 [marine sediment metagenome]|uniref:Phage protein Gp37/Gp68 n=1 Tax=marine sediment metagenome TaxID=412755 RepID=A0A0F9M0Y0_9ZZZZ